MAKHTPRLEGGRAPFGPDPGTSPEVRFERSDVESKGVVTFAICLALSVLFVIVSMLWFGRVLLDEYRKPDPLNLPRAAVDDEPRPPEPRLEAIDDVRAGRTRLYPPRAAEYYRPQVDLLAGGAGEQVLPIDSAIDAASKLLPVRKTGDRAAPVNFLIRLPSKASSGWTTTGGQ